MADASTSMSYPIAATDVLAEEIWSTKLHEEALFENWFNQHGMMGEEKGGEDPFERPSGLPIMYKSEFGKEAGQQLHMAMQRQLQRGVRLDENGASTLTTYTRGSSYAVGYEEAMAFLDMTVWLDKLKHFVANDSPDLFQHRTAIKMEPAMRRGLSTWLTAQEEELVIDGYVDGSAYIAIQDSLTSAVDHPNMYYREGASSNDTLGESHVMTARELRRIMRFCQVKKLSPIKINGESCYVVLMSSALVASLLEDDEFQRVCAQAQVRGDKNPLVSGSIGRFYNLYIHSYERARTVTSYSHVEQVMVLGANSLALGYGSEPRFTTRNEDGYGDRFGRGIARIIGCARADWYDNGTTLTLNQSSGLWKVYKPLDDFD